VAIQVLRQESKYVDSVTLMNLARHLRALPGIEDAALVMGTQANKNLLAQAGMMAPELGDASPNDLLVVVKGAPDSLPLALRKAEELLSSMRPAIATAHGEHAPRTLRSAALAHPEANLALISVAGRYATAEAWTALHQGLHVMLFSDNVSLEDEIALKQYALAHDLLMMGPGAGSAIINGMALGFANAVPRGPVGIVSAAGTGLQEVSSLLARQGVGISQGIGVGGRDLSDEVGGAMMLRGLQALLEDPQTKVLVVISKLPSPHVAARVEATLQSRDKPAVVAFMGRQPAEGLLPPQGRLQRASTLEEAALVAGALAQGINPAEIRAYLEERTQRLQQQACDLRKELLPGQRYLRGLFSGGTLCEEAIRIWKLRLGKVWSNSPLSAEEMLPDPTTSIAHTALDLGEEVFTIGRPHPMLDNDLRIRRLLLESADPSVVAIQMDIVLGYGAHPDPAAELGPAIEHARKIARQGDASLAVITSITGTEADPQGLARQRATLESHGALVMESNAAASTLAAFLPQGRENEGLRPNERQD
jgi:FdrA protein